MIPFQAVLPASSIGRVLIALVTFIFLAVALSAPVAAAKGGNSANAKLCQKGGWEDWVRQDQTTFASEEECVSYGAMGGTLAVPAPHLTISPGSFGSSVDPIIMGPNETRSQTFTLTNDGGLTTGTLTLHGTTPIITLTNNSCFGSSLAAGGSCTFDITFVTTILCQGGVSFNSSLWITDPGHPGFPGYLSFPVAGRCP